MKFLKLKKYNYDTNKVIGVKPEDPNAYIFLGKSKVIRRYHDKLKSSALICSYLPIEEIIPFSLEIEKSLYDKINLDNYIKTKIYEEANLPEQEKYIYRYEIVESIDNKKVFIQVYLISEFLIKEKFKEFYEEVGYLDYLSFPGFSFKYLYKSGLLEKATDVFVILLKDKIMLTLYKNGQFITSTIIKNGLNDLYEEMKNLKIKNFNEDIFKKLLKQKGLNEEKYSEKEKRVVFDGKIKPFFGKISETLENEIEKILEKYEVKYVDRIYITSFLGTINNLEKFISEKLNIDTFTFSFYDKYNLDKLDIDPLLFLAMLETYYSYKLGEIKQFNFSIKLRQANFFFRPIGHFTLVIIGSLIIGSIPLIYLKINSLIYSLKLKKINDVKIQYIKKNALISRDNLTLQQKIKERKEIINEIGKEKKRLKNLINEAVVLKVFYHPKSILLYKIIKEINKDNIELMKLRIIKNYVYLEVKSDSEKKLATIYHNLSNYFSKTELTGIKKVKENNKVYYIEELLFYI